MNLLNLTGDPLHTVLDNVLYECMAARRTCRALRDHSADRLLVKVLKARHICDRYMLTAIPRVPCHERGVGLAFLEAMAREVPLGTTPGQLVHGSHTTGPPDDWQDFDLSQDALCFRAVALCTG